MRVLYLVSSLVLSGPTRQLYYLCKYGPSAGYAPVVLTLSSSPARNLDKAFDELPVRLLSLDLSRFDGLIRGAARVRNALSRERPDVLHTSGIRSDRIGHRVANATPHVLTVRNFAWDDYPPRYGRVLGSMMAYSHLNVVRRAHCPVACSPALAQRLRSVRPDVRMIPNGVDTDAFGLSSPDEKRAARQRLGLTADRRVIIAVGSLIPRKRPDILLDAFLQSPAAGYSDLVFVGDGPLRATLEGRCKDRTEVSFAGQVSGIADFLRAADLFVSASKSEGLPNSVLEALSAGLPVLLSDIDAHRQLGVEESGAGRIVDVNRIDEFGAAMDEMARSDLPAPGEAARKLAVSRFSAQTMAQSYAELYSSLV